MPGGFRAVAESSEVGISLESYFLEWSGQNILQDQGNGGPVSCLVGSREMVFMAAMMERLFHSSQFEVRTLD